MGEVVPFIRVVARAEAEDDAPDIDLETAVDVAIRDLHDIEQGLGAENVRALASECRRMLAFALERSRA